MGCSFRSIATSAVSKTSSTWVLFNVYRRFLILNQCAKSSTALEAAEPLPKCLSNLDAMMGGNVTFILAGMVYQFRCGNQE